MLSLLRHLLALIILVSLTSCDKGPTAREQEAIAKAEQERIARINAETAAHEANQGKSTWQTVSFVVGISAVVLLVFGTALGSSARKHAKEQKAQQDDQLR